MDTHNIREHHAYDALQCWGSGRIPRPYRQMDHPYLGHTFRRTFAQSPGTYSRVVRYPFRHPQSGLASCGHTTPAPAGSLVHHRGMRQPGWNHLSCAYLLCIVVPQAWEVRNILRGRYLAVDHA